MAAVRGARVAILEKSKFPRDKPCGDGLTPRAVRLLSEMGLSEQICRFQRVDKIRISVGWRTHEEPWPVRGGFAGHGFVIPRTALDEMLVRHAQSAGAVLYEQSEALTTLEKNGLVQGVRVRCGQRVEDVMANVVVLADGARAGLGRSIGMHHGDGLAAIAVRAQVESKRGDDSTIEVFALPDGNGLMPGYGWVFPMGNGRINVGVGLILSSPRWKRVNVGRVAHDFIRSLPHEWQVPSMRKLLQSGQLKGWRLPMGLSVWPPWRPGVMAVGDAAGVAKPSTGAGISKAIQSGLSAARVALRALDGEGPRDLSLYASHLQTLWGSYYQQGERLIRLLRNRFAFRLVTEAGMSIAPVQAALRRHILRL